jgi:hypothetical protein
MTMNLYWEPAQREPEGDLSDKLKFVLRKRCGGTVDTVLSEMDIQYLNGLIDAGVEDAQQLIDAIEKHGSIRVFER